MAKRRPDPTLVQAHPDRSEVVEVVRLLDAEEQSPWSLLSLCEAFPAVPVLSLRRRLLVGEPGV